MARGRTAEKKENMQESKIIPIPTALDAYKNAWYAVRKRARNDQRAESVSYLNKYFYI